MIEYIESLEASGEKLTEEAWRDWIKKEIDDMQQQNPQTEIINIYEVIETLKKDGFVI